MSTQSTRLPAIIAAVALIVSLASVGLALAQQSELGELRAQLARAARAPAPSLDERPDTSGTNLELAERLRELEAEVGRLRRARGAAPTNAGSGAAATDAANTQPRAPLPAGSDQATVFGVLESEDPEVRQRFRGVLREEMRALRDERVADRQEQRKMELEARFNEFAQSSSLTGQQREELEPMLLDEQKEIHRIRQDARAGDMDRRSAREQVQALREETDKRAGELLDEQQLGEYKEMREQDRPGRRGPPRP